MLDEFHGVGGSYVVDPQTCQRQPAPAEQDQPENPPESAGFLTPATTDNEAN